MTARQVCLICLKIFNTCVVDGSNNTDKQTDPFTIFLNFLEKHLRVPLNLTTFAPLKDSLWIDGRCSKSVFCHECKEFVNTICKLFQEMCKIQANLAIKLGKLTELLENSCGDKHGGEKRENSLLSTLASQWNGVGDEDGVGHEDVSSRQILEMRVLLGHYCKLESLKHMSNQTSPEEEPHLSNKVNLTNNKTEVKTRWSLIHVPPSANEADNSLVEQDIVVKEETLDIDTENADIQVNIRKEFGKSSPTESEQYGSDDDDILDNEWMDDDNDGKSQASISSSSECDDSNEGWSANTCSRGRGRPGRGKKGRPFKKVEIVKKSSTSSDSKIKTYVVPKPRLIAEKLDVYANEVWRCQYCEKILRGGTSLVNHLKNNHEKEDAEKLHPCYLCFRTYSLEQSRSVHLKLFHWKQKLDFSCQVCREGLCGSPSFENMEDLHTHFQETHKNQPIYCCTKCNWPFLSQNRRLLHEIFHTEIKPGSKRRYPCPMDGCASYAESPKKLASHYSSKHDIQEITLTCPTCKKGFSNEHSLSRHRRIHYIQETKGPEYKCPHCSKFNSCQQQLDSHVKLKHTLKTCPDCGIQMYYDSYRRHVYKKHGKGTWGTVHLCQECGKECGNRYELRKHMEIKHHPDGKKRPPEFVCSECGKCYHSRVALEVHMKMGHMSAEEKAKLPVVIGKGKWNSRCLKCGKVFRWESDVMLHLVMKRSCNNYVMKKAGVSNMKNEDVLDVDGDGNMGDESSEDPDQIPT